MEYRLTDLCELIMGQSPDSSSCNKDGKGIPFYQGNADFGEKNPTPRNWCLQPKKIAQKDDILISVRAPIGDLNIANEDCCIGRGVAAIRMKSKECDRDYLYLFLESKSKYLQDCGTGSTFTAINKGVLESLKVKCPELKNQTSIANEIENIKAAIKYKNSELICLNEAVQSEFVEMFGEEPVESGKWKVRKLGDVASDVKYGTSYSAVENGQYKYLRMNNLTSDGYLNLEDLKFIDISDDEYEKFVVRKGDILFNRTNSREHVGKTALYNLDEEMIIAGYLIRVRFYKEVNPYFFVQFMNIPYMKRVLKKTARGAVNQANINSQELKSLLIPVPPINLQNQFAAFVQQIDKSKFVLYQQLQFTEKYAIIFKEIK